MYRTIYLLYCSCTTTTLLESNRMWYYIGALHGQRTLRTHVTINVEYLQRNACNYRMAKRWAHADQCLIFICFIVRVRQLEMVNHCKCVGIFSCTLFVHFYVHTMYFSDLTMKSICSSILCWSHVKSQ